ncbi:hypothetical protein BDF20DRAFT_916839 [Mycotypha africana]|uniref:uncharacterized protein n=1 Tax=Mycotypha africana TaxID=64632 RepID=UPI00230008C0|nr:uncharacterized protein BDF20DRAFT_916839 [Mycotypha africana]KAI8968293.1 hypothetical protein BDF20DRAFT_916839 [Mycotypha africana]
MSSTIIDGVAHQLPTINGSDSESRYSNRYSKRNSALNVDLMINTDLKSMNEEGEEEYTPTPRAARRQLSINSRRRSTLLYLEKYGLDQPNWHENNSSDYEQSNDSGGNSSNSRHYDDGVGQPQQQPLTVDNNTCENNGVVFRKGGEQEEQERRTDIYGPNKQKIIAVELQPKAVKNIKNHYSQKRPTQFIKPEKTAVTTVETISQPNSEFQNVFMLMEEFTDKLYMEGYLYKRVDVTSDGTLSRRTNWTLWYVELCGSVLTLWDASNKSTTVYPQYINITDAIICNEPHLTSEARTNIFSLNTAGANRYLFQTNHTADFHRWILALRLSCFEAARIQEVYTRAFLISRPNSRKFLAPNTQKTILFEGFVQVRFSGQTTRWKRVWAVVSNHKVEKRLIFNKKLIPTQGQIMFYENKKAKTPFMTMENVIQAYKMYPESPKMIDVATMFKIEGSMYKISKQNRQPQLVSSSCCALMMTANIQELVEWLMAVYDAFQLYGRPQKLLDDPNNPKALNFADGMGLFLYTDEAQQAIDMEQHATMMTDLAASKQEFTRLLTDKLKHGSVTPLIPSSAMQSPSLSPPQRPSSPASSLSPSSPSPSRPTSPTIANRTSFTSQNRHPSAKTNFAQQLFINGPTQLRNVTYASDDEDEEEDDENEEDQSAPESDEEEDEDRSLFKFGTKPQQLITATHNSKNPSKSSSEVSDESSPATLPDTSLVDQLPASQQQQRSLYFLNSHHRLSQQQQVFGSEKEEVQKDVNDDMSMPIAAAVAVDDFITQNSLLDQHQRQHTTPKKKVLQNKARATRQPFFTIDQGQQYQQQSANPVGLVDLTPDKGPQTDKSHSRLMGPNYCRRSMMTMPPMPNPILMMDDQNLNGMSLLNYQQFLMQQQFNMYHVPSSPLMMTAPPLPHPYGYAMMMPPVPTPSISAPMFSSPMTPPMLYEQQQQQQQYNYPPHQRTMSSPTPSQGSLTSRLSKLMVNEQQQQHHQQPFYYNSYYNNSPSTATVSSRHSSGSNNSSSPSGSLRQKKPRHRPSVTSQTNTNHYDNSNSSHSLPRKTMHH